MIWRSLFLLVLTFNASISNAQKRYEYSRLQLGVPFKVGKSFPLDADFKVITKVAYELGLQVHFKINEKSGLVANVGYGVNLINVNAMQAVLKQRYSKENYINTQFSSAQEWDNLQMTLAYSHKLPNNNIKLLAGVSILRLYTSPNFVYELTHAQNSNDVLNNRVQARSNYRRSFFGPLVGAQFTLQVLKGILLIAQPEISYHFGKYYAYEIKDGPYIYNDISVGLSGLNMGVRLGFMLTPYNGIHPYEDEK